MTYSRRVQIARHGPTEIFAEAGDQFQGTWGNGDIEGGRLIRAAGGHTDVFPGRRPNPHDISND